MGRTVTGRMAIAAAVISVLLLHAPPATTGDSEVHRHKMPGQGTLLLSYPKPWKESVTRLRGLGSTRIELTVPPDSDPAIQITAIGGDGCRAMANDVAALQQAVGRQMRAAGASAEEGSVRLFKLRAESGDGFIFTATVTAPEEGGYKYLWQGTRIVSGQICLALTVLTNHKESPGVETALRAIKGATFKAR